MSTNVIIDERVGTQSLPQLPTGEAALVGSRITGKKTGAGIFSRVFSFPAMLAILLVGIIFAAGQAFHVDPDLWWHIKVGQEILSTHHWPTVDPYSFTVSAQPWLAYEWLGSTVLAKSYELTGLSGLAVLLVFMGSLVVIALYCLATLRCGNCKAGFLTATLLSPFAIMSFSLRPQMLGYLFLILTLLVLERFRQGKPRAVWFLPVIMLLWVNTHGSWIIGIGAIFVYWMSGLWDFRIGALRARPWIERERRRISFAFLLCLSVLPLTPYGVRVAASPFEFAFSLPLNVTNIQEWQSMPFHTVIGKIFLLFLLALIVKQVVVQSSWRLEEFVLFLFGTLMACLHVRFLLVFVPFAVPVVAEALARWVPQYDVSKDKLILNAAVMVVVLGCVIKFFPSHQEIEQKVAAAFPVDAVAYLQSHPLPGRMFNSYGFGGYLVWSRGPQNKVFIDGRADVYERGGVLADYLHIAGLKPGALAILRNYGIQSCLLQRDEPLSTVLYSSPNWKRIYTDNVSALFVRVGP